jgi:hypothetical protein
MHNFFSPQAFDLEVWISFDLRYGENCSKIYLTVLTLLSHRIFCDWIQQFVIKKLSSTFNLIIFWSLKMWEWSKIWLSFTCHIWISLHQNNSVILSFSSQFVIMEIHSKVQFSPSGQMNQILINFWWEAEDTLIYTSLWWKWNQHKHRNQKESRQIFGLSKHLTKTPQVSSEEDKGTLLRTRKDLK